jgi:hypothetical protein
MGSPAVRRLDHAKIIHRLGKTLLMTIGILAAVLGLLIAVVAITIPRLVGRGNHPEDHADSRAYLKETGRSAEDIVRGNAGRAPQEENDARSQQAGDSDSPSPRND